MARTPQTETARIGYVNIDSGMVLITDPGSAAEAGDYIEQAAENGTMLLGQVGNAAVCDMGIGNGLYEVSVVRYHPNDKAVDPDERGRILCLKMVLTDD